MPDESRLVSHDEQNEKSIHDSIHDAESSRPEAQGERFPREFDSAELLRGEKEILIRHAGEVYRLRLTRNDKLILQK
jgi:hemin uptake protein HemP